MGRIFAIMTILWMAMLSLGLSTPLAQAQTTPPAETTQAATPNLTDIPFEQQSDALKAAFEARAKADMAILEALATQKNAQDEAEATKAAAEKGATTQPSNFTPDAIKAKAQGFLDQLIVWSKSPSFLAQIVAIIFAYFLSAIAAGMLKKRIPLWSREPDATAKLLPVRKIVYRAGEFLRPIVVVTLLAFFAIILKALPNFGQDWLVKIAQAPCLSQTRNVDIGASRALGGRRLFR